MAKKLPYVPRRPTPIGNPNNFWDDEDDDTIAIDESSILLDKPKKKNKKRASKHNLNLSLIL